jgi:microcin C transport system permease protein
MAVAEPFTPGSHNPPPASPPPPPERKRFSLSPINQRRWRNFKKNRRALWSLWIFSILFGLSLFAEFIANDKPILVQYRGEYFTPVLNFYPETAFGGDFRTEAIYRDPEVQCLIVSGGLEDCFDDPEGIMEDAEDGVVNGTEIEKGWAIWPPIPYHYSRPVDIPGAAPSPPTSTNLLGTDDTKRDVLARVIYGFRLSVMFTLIVTVCSFSRSWAGDSGCWWGSPSCSAGRPSSAWCAPSSCARGTSSMSGRHVRSGYRTGRSCSATCCPTRWSRR